MIFLIINLLLNTINACLLPSDWHGYWYQQKYSNLATINRTNFLNKGICLYHKQDKYLFYEPNESCYRCVFVIQKHSNVLQYRSTYCGDSNDFDLNCDLLTPESELLTIYRDTKIYETCALNGIYKEKDDQCNESSSYLMQCTQKTSLKLEFNKCMNKSLLELNCIANWNDGNIQYLIGKTKYGQYKCILYTQHDNYVKLSIAYDEFCRTFDNLDENQASSSINFVKLQENIQNEDTCRFPRWLNRKWISINDPQKVYYLDNKLDSLIVLEKSTINRLNCMQITNKKSTNHFSAIIKSTNGCLTGYQCLTIHIRSEFVLELKLSKLSYDLSNVDCHNIDHYELVYIDTSFGITCPFKGQVFSQIKYPLNEIPQCKYATQTQLLKIGCSNEQQYSLRTSLCYPNRGIIAHRLQNDVSTSATSLYTQLESEINLSCLAYWPLNNHNSIENTLFLVSRSMSNEIICSIWSLNSLNKTLNLYEIDKNCYEYRKKISMKRITHEFKFQSTCNEQIQAHPLSKSIKIRPYLNILIMMFMLCL